MEDETQLAMFDDYAELTVHVNGEPRLRVVTLYTDDNADHKVFYDLQAHLPQVAKHLRLALEAVRYEYWRTTTNGHYFDKFVFGAKRPSVGEETNDPGV